MFEKFILFPTNVWKTHVNANEYDKNNIVSAMTENYSRDPYRNAWTNDGTLHHCYNDWNNPKFITPDVTSLMSLYSRKIEEFINHISTLCLKVPRYNYVLTNLTANKAGQYMGEHDHLAFDGKCGCVFSMVHYLKLEDHQPSTTFFNPVVAGQHYTTFDYASKHLNSLNIENSAVYPVWEIPTNEDDIVIFPAYLKHKVRGNWKQKSPDELRITSVVNINFFVD